MGLSPASSARIEANMDRIVASVDLQDELDQIRHFQRSAAKHCRCASKAANAHDDDRAITESERAIGVLHESFCGLGRLVEKERILVERLAAQNAALSAGISIDSLEAEEAAA